MARNKVGSKCIVLHLHGKLTDFGLILGDGQILLLYESELILQQSRFACSIEYHIMCLNFCRLSRIYTPLDNAVDILPLMNRKLLGLIVIMFEYIKYSNASLILSLLLHNLYL